MKTLHEVTYNDPLVNRMMKDGMSLKDIICAMHERHEEMFSKLMKAESSASKRYRFSDGIEAIYNPPPDLIPVINLPGPSTTFQNFVKPARDIRTIQHANPSEAKITLCSTFKGWKWEEGFDNIDFIEDRDACLKKHLVKANLFFDIQEV